VQCPMKFSNRSLLLTHILTHGVTQAVAISVLILPAIAQTESLSAPENSDETISSDEFEEIEFEGEETELIITGEQVPVFVPSSTPAYIVPKAEIQRQNPNSTAELLRSLPGFAINDYGFGADIHTGTFLRGFSINQSSFQINGRSFGSNINTYHGATDLNSIPVSVW